MANGNEKKNGKNNNQQKMIRKNGYKIMEEKHKERPDKKYKEIRKIK